MIEKYFKIAKLRVSGIKSLRKEIEVSFLSKSIAPKSPYEGNVKSFYGENGSGKTALIYALEILNQLLSDENYLANRENQRMLSELFNKSSQEINLYISYLKYDFDKDSIEAVMSDYQYLDFSITLKTNSFGQFYIYKQALDLYQVDDLKKEKSKSYTFESREGQVVSASTTDFIKHKLQNQLMAKSFPALLKSIITDVIARSYVDVMAREDNEPYFEYLIRNVLNMSEVEGKVFLVEALLYMHLIGIVSKTEIHVGVEDKLDIIKKKNYPEVLFNTSKPTESTAKFNPSFEELMHHDDDYLELIRMQRNSYDVNGPKFIISRDEKKQFEKEMSYRTEIIRLFKPDIQCLAPYYTDISSKNKYIMAHIGFDYGDYVVPLYLESSGTRKLFEFADSIKTLYNGGIVIFDELDSGLHDIILSRLVQFVSESCIGQLIFTTHNLAPMDVLESKKDAIDFINRNQEIVKWVKRGNSKSANFYRSGKVKGIPHNLSSDDFLRILGKETRDD